MRLALDRIRYWLFKKMNNPSKTFRVEDGGEGKSLNITLLGGRYRDVQVEFLGLQLREDEEGGTLDFFTRVKENPHQANIKSNHFEWTVTYILRIIIEEVVREEQERAPNVGRTIDTEELDESRDVLSEDPSIYEEPLSDRKSRPKNIRRDS